MEIFWVMPYRLLIVDDEEAIRFAMEDYFTTAGHQVDCTHQAAEAKALLAQSRYAAVIVDLHLTGLQGTEGLDIVSYVRQQCPATCIIMLTAYGTPDIEHEARRRGVDAFLHKPTPLPEIAQVVCAVIRARDPKPPS